MTIFWTVLPDTLHIIITLFSNIFPVSKNTTIYKLALSYIAADWVSNDFSRRHKPDKQKPNMLIIHLCLVFHENETIRSIVSIRSACLWDELFVSIMHQCRSWVCLCGQMTRITVTEKKVLLFVCFFPSLLFYILSVDTLITRLGKVTENSCQNRCLIQLIETFKLFVIDLNSFFIEGWNQSRYLLKTKQILQTYKFSHKFS